MYARNKWSQVSERIGRRHLSLGQFHVLHPPLNFVTLEQLYAEEEKRLAKWRR